LFCEEEEETIEHLFLHCNFSWKVWMDVLKWWNVFLPMAASHVNWFEALLGVLSGGFKGKLWITSCFVVFYSLWDQRNKLAFENKKMEWLELAYLIKMRVGFWMKGWCPSCPYSPIDLTRDVEAVCNWRLKHTSRTCVEWNKPPYNVWKWNVDGSSRGKPGAAGIGDSNEAEFVAIVYALEQSMGKDWLLNGSIIIESDSVNALTWVKRKECCPWSLRFVCNKLNNLLLAIKNVEFVHVNREANEAADRLAKRASCSSDSWIHWY
jgi:ribonuclease HI